MITSYLLEKKNKMAYFIVLWKLYVYIFIKSVRRVRWKILNKSQRLNSNKWEMIIYSNLHDNIQQFKRTQLGFPGGSVVKNLPTNAGTGSSIIDLGRCTATKLMCYNNWACTLVPGSCSYWAMCHNHWSLCVLEPVLHKKRSHHSE